MRRGQREHCVDDELAYALDLRNDGFSTAQSGRVTVTLEGAVFASCDLTVTR